jgi:hypothetical protein
MVFVGCWASDSHSSQLTRSTVTVTQAASNTAGPGPVNNSRSLLAEEVSCSWIQQHSCSRLLQRVKATLYQFLHHNRRAVRVLRTKWRGVQTAL